LLSCCFQRHLQLGFFVAANAAAFGQGSLLLHELIVLNLEQAQVHKAAKAALREYQQARALRYRDLDALAGKTP